MAARGSGAIINIASINGLLGMAESARYSVTKATIHVATRVARMLQTVRRR
jgi:short-subunit dehydrogenase